MPTTPNRQTLLQADIGEITARRPAFHYSRPARDIGKGLVEGAARPVGTFLAPRGDAWLLKPVGATDILDFLRLDTPAGSRFVTGGDVNAASGMQSVLMWRKDTDITGLGGDPDLIASGLTLFQKGIPAGADASLQNLAADAAAYPSPLPPTAQSYPLDRVLAGTHTYEENTPYRLFYDEPPGAVPSDAYLTFMFGGQTDVREAGHSGGEFALMFRGNREALLYERDRFRIADGGWRLQADISLVGPNYRAAGSIKQSLTVIPYASNRIAIINKAFSLNLVLMSTGPVFGQPLGMTRSEFAPFYGENLWIDQPGDTGHTHIRAVTGAGPVRLDVQRNYLETFGLATMVYPAGGTVPDSPFLIPHALDAGTPIVVRIFGYLLGGTTITAHLYDAATGAPADFDVGLGAFRSIAGQSAYYLSFTLNSPDGIQTPVLWGYTVDVDPVWVTNARTPTVSSWLHSVNVKGADLDPADEQAVLHINDPLNQLVVLRERSRVRSVVSVVDTTTGIVAAHLGEYESTEQAWRRRGKPSYQFPTPDWWDIEDGTFRGLWARIVGQFFQGQPETFLEDAAAAVDPATGRRPPWKWTDILRYLFTAAGVPDDELDIPDLALRRWVGVGDPFGDALHAGTDLGTAILTIIHDYLGGVLVRDAVAGSRGMWRLGFAPADTSTNYICSFLTDEPGLGTPVDVMSVRTYSANQNVVAFQEGTYHHKHVAPEFSVCCVIGIAPGQPGYLYSVRENPNAFNPGHPDYLGFYLPFIRKPDPALPTLEACNWVRDQYVRLAGHGQDWWMGRAPLMLVRDTFDVMQNLTLLRPPRINDLCLVAGTRALIKSCNPRYSRSDEVQMADYEGVFL